jgi:hypothetical protein
MTEREPRKKFISPNMAIVLQTIALIIALFGLVVAAERRINTIEMKTAFEIETRSTQDKAMMDAIRGLQEATSQMSGNQVRVVTLLDKIEQRHTLEDQKAKTAR